MRDNEEDMVKEEVKASGTRSLLQCRIPREAEVTCLCNLVFTNSTLVRTHGAVSRPTYRDRRAVGPRAHRSPCDAFSRASSLWVLP